LFNEIVRDTSALVINAARCARGTKSWLASRLITTLMSHSACSFVFAACAIAYVIGNSVYVAPFHTACE
jgi:hypothetical protein